MTKQTTEINLLPFINKMIKGNFELITNQIKLEYDVEICKRDMFGNFDESDTILYDQVNKFNCFTRRIGYDNLSKLKEERYLFKKSFSLLFTDIYIQNGLVKNDLMVTTNYIYFVLDYALKAYIDCVINASTFGEKSKYLIDNLHLLYKGGNTTRMILNCFIDSSKLAMVGKISNKINNSITSLDNLIETYAVGDWDYSVKINYNVLRNLRNNDNYTDDELQLITKHINQLYTYVSVYLKDRLNLLLMSKLNINNTTKEIQKLLFSSDISTKIDKFVQSNNILSPNLSKIYTLSINKIYTFGKVITKTNSRDMFENEFGIINKKSFVFSGTNKVVDNNTIDQYFEVNNNYIYNDSKNYLFELSEITPAYISFLPVLPLLKRYGLASFALIRVKINNLIKLKGSYVNNTPLTKNLFVNMELIDISI